MLSGWLVATSYEILRLRVYRIPSRDFLQVYRQYTPLIVTGLVQFYSAACLQWPVVSSLELRIVPIPMDALLGSSINTVQASN
jgi:hypothetical protein